ncbi:hypothetical protein BJ875DRAFT_370623 [Amylocarpus encephaloides]|uniref:Zn(2)-C6 fungal-type domain-containing protein n=1 Tax=Amylocarpus encephaloides TaxID=45428 RepID=A0A9P8C8A9_9HELO|nr:hypothetical protein BJ875DRAFT_370623 [Amylocarpus encephaloides]
MSGSRASKGCLPCRTRRVKCDEGRPSCDRCVKRKETCTSYREPGTTFAWRDENEKAAYLSHSRVKRSVRERVQDLERSSKSTSVSTSGASTSSARATSKAPLGNEDEVSLDGLKLGGNPTPWLRNQTASASTEKLAIDAFFKDYVLFPCTSTSTPGFLEQLPCLFEEVNTIQISGRSALRWAVKAVSFASLAAKLPSDSSLPGIEQAMTKRGVRMQADRAFGHALTSLATCLSAENEDEKVSDYTLMTVVVLDLFEALFQPGVDIYGAHTQGVAHLLRIRGPDQLVTPRGWSLFRVSQHRLQRQQLAFPPGEAPKQSPEQEALLGMLNEEMPEASIEQTNFDISKICARARGLRGKLASAVLVNSPRVADEKTQEVIDLVKEMHELDGKASKWRAGDNWSYRTAPTSSLRYPDSGEGGSELEREELEKWPETTTLYPDLWIAYEWNYHRTARMLLHVQILACLHTLPHALSRDAEGLTHHSLTSIATLADEISSTIPQSLGDVSATGFLLTSPLPASNASSPPRDDPSDEEARVHVSAIGAYFLLWPLKVVKECAFASASQRGLAREAFERMRRVTGMEGRLGDGAPNGEGGRGGHSRVRPTRS